MKHYILSLFASFFILTGCVELNLNPLTDGSSENWFSSVEEIEMALNELYGEDYWYFDTYRYYNSDRWTDDWNQREYVYDYLKGEVSSTWGDTKKHYGRFYKAVARANTIIEGVGKFSENLTRQQINQYLAEASFFRAVAYSYLIFLYGDVPFYTEWISLDEAYAKGKTPKKDILEQIYTDFDTAISHLPSSYNGLKRVTRGAAYAFKARTALWNSDWDICAKACRGCISTGEFELEKDFSKAVSTETKGSREFIFYIPRSAALTPIDKLSKVTSYYPRILGGTANAQPSIDAFCAFLCDDGKTIDKSSVYDPIHPFEHRDPRLKASFVEFGTELLGSVIDPRPWVTTVTKNGTSVKNKDNRVIDEYAAYNGLTLRKGVTEDWVDDKTHTGDIVIMRYANIFLMLAEAKCELGEIDDEAREAINKVRARAYGVDFRSESYPAVTTSDQDEFRTTVRIERRMELMFENHRFFDIIRWRIAEKALDKPMVGIMPSKLKLVEKGDESAWFFPETPVPTVDKDGVVDLKNTILGKNCFYQVAFSTFNERQYLFPFPAEEILICPNITQNEGY